MKRILQCVSNFDIGGVQTFIMNNYKYIDKSKFVFDVFVMTGIDSPYIKEIEANGGKVYFAKQQFSYKHIIKLINLWYKFMKDGKYDVVHAHHNLTNAWVLLAAKMARIPVRISHSHSTDHFKSSYIQRSFSYLRRYLVNHLSTIRLACGEEAGCNMYGANSDYKVIKNGIETEKFVRVEEKDLDNLRKELRIGKEAKIYANVSRFSLQKNQTFIVDIFYNIHKKEPGSVLLLGGPGDNEFKEQALKKIEQFDLSDCVRIVGPRKDMPLIYHLADCWIAPSLWEGLSIMMIELQTTSTPIVTSDVVTKETDLGLGLIKFQSLNDSAERWADTSMRANKQLIDKELIRSKLKEYGYDIRICAKQLQNYYEL